MPNRTRPTESSCDGIVCYAGVDWWYHNRGHSECQILRRLSAGRPVLWVNSIGMRAPRPGKTQVPLARYFRKLKSTLRFLRRDESGMWIYSPLFIPRYDQRTVELNGRLLHAQTRALCRFLGIRRPSVFVTIPTAAPAVARGSWNQVLFNRSDDFAAFPEADAAFVTPLVDRLLQMSDTVLYVNRHLYESERERVRSAVYLGHGVDYGHFADARPAHRPPAEAPERIRDLPRPIVGFYGALDDYTIDLDLMIQSARRIPSGTLLVIGPQAMEISRLLAEPNVVYLGPIPYSELPAYAAQFDVALMPWLQNDWIHHCNPIKLKEYLALGFPVVTIHFDELAAYEGLVHAARSREEFLAGLDRALADRDPDAVARRRAAVREDSWDALANRVSGLVEAEAPVPREVSCAK